MLYISSSSYGDLWHERAIGENAVVLGVEVVVPWWCHGGHNFVNIMQILQRTLHKAHPNALALNSVKQCNVLSICIAIIHWQ